MAEKTYIIGIDQSTQGTKALLFDRRGLLLGREDLPHRQIVNGQGWVSHDPEEIYSNTVQVVRRLLQSQRVAPEHVAALGISNQRETSLVWERKTGRPVADAIVWQCARAESVCERVKAQGVAEQIRQKTGIPLSPYYPASKLAWLLENTEQAKEKAARHELCMGTVDTWLVYKMTCGSVYKTDYSNASRTQLFNIFDLKWDEEICGLFGIDPGDMAEVCDSDSVFGETDLEGTFPHPIPIHGVLGDSHGALFGQGCLEKGMIKATCGTGSSIMMNIGESPVLSTHGVVTSLAWGMGGKVNYVLEGNINYTGAVISWLKDEVGLIASAGETEEISREAVQDDSLYFVPAFTGLGAPWWDSRATGSLSGITRTTGKKEIVRACVECIAYQIADVVNAMSADARQADETACQDGAKTCADVKEPVSRTDGASAKENAPRMDDALIKELRVDGGPTRNGYLMQFMSDILGASVLVPDAEELSGIGAAYAAGIGVGLYGKDIFDGARRKVYLPRMSEKMRDKKYSGWKRAVAGVLTKE